MKRCVRTFYHIDLAAVGPIGPEEPEGGPNTANAAGPVGISTCR
jgi:hypothetical protein